MNFNASLFLYSFLVVMIYLIDVRTSLFYPGVHGVDWNKRHPSILSNEVEGESRVTENDVMPDLEASYDPKDAAASSPYDRELLIEECCPTTRDWITPKGGVSRKGRILELFRNENVSQAFLQISCRPEVKNKPCVFLRKIYGQSSRCVQQYTYSYAIVRDLEADQDAPFSVDHIRVRSGCTCIVAAEFLKYQLRKNTGLAAAGGGGSSSSGGSSQYPRFPSPGKRQMDHRSRRPTDSHPLHLLESHDDEDDDADDDVLLQDDVKGRQRAKGQAGSFGVMEASPSIAGLDDLWDKRTADSISKSTTEATADTRSQHREKGGKKILQ